MIKSLPRLNYGILLDNLKYPGNIGAIIRTAHAFGAGEIIIFGYESITRPMRMAARNLHRWENINFFLEVEPLIQHIESKKYDLVIIDTCPEASSVSSFNFPKKPLFVFGHESLGVEDFLKKENNIIYIPQIGTQNSINVSSAASIILYELYKQRW